MAKPTLTQVFGDLATQTATDLVIKKSDLVEYGHLDPVASNSPEALLVAILLTAYNELTEANRSLDRDNRKLSIFLSSQDLVMQGNLPYRRSVLSVSCYQPEPLQVIEANAFE